MEYLALDGGPPRFKPGSSCPVLLRILSRDISVSHTGLSPSSIGLPRPFWYQYDFLLLIESPTTPHPKMWFGLFQFRSPLLSESRLISSPWGTKMVQFPQYRFNILYIQISMTKYYPSRVTPFGNLRINACLQLPVAFRSLPRPSSPHGA